jgi:hypothetical protein
MVARLLYAYCRGQRSARVIECECVEDVAYRASLGPDHRIPDGCWGIIGHANTGADIAAAARAELAAASPPSKA